MCEQRVNSVSTDEKRLRWVLETNTYTGNWFNSLSFSATFGRKLSNVLKFAVARKPFSRLITSSPKFELLNCLPECPFDQVFIGFVHRNVFRIDWKITFTTKKWKDFPYTVSRWPKVSCHDPFQEKLEVPSYREPLSYFAAPNLLGFCKAFDQCKWLSGYSSFPFGWQKLTLRFHVPWFRSILVIVKVSVITIEIIEYYYYYWLFQIRALVLLLSTNNPALNAS